MDEIKIGFPSSVKPTKFIKYLKGGLKKVSNIDIDIKFGGVDKKEKENIYCITANEAIDFYRVGFFIATMYELGNKQKNKACSTYHFPIIGTIS